MGTISKPNTFSPSTSAASSQVNANFDTIYNEFNGNISAANLATDAVTTAKIADSNVTTAKIADSNVTTAKIADSAITPAKRSGGFKVGSFTTSATGNLSITGVGFTPKFVLFNTLPTTSTTILRGGQGAMDASGGQWAMALNAEEGGDISSESKTDACILSVAGNNVDTVVGAFVSMDADGFTINISTHVTARTFGYIAYA